MTIKDRLPSPESLLESLSLPRDFLTRLGILAGQTTRKVSVETVAISSGSLTNVEIGKVNLGNASIGTVTISDVSATLEQSSAFLQNVRALLTSFRNEVDEKSIVACWESLLNTG